MANSLLNDEQQETGSPETSAEALERIPTAPRPGKPNDYPGRKPYDEPNNVDIADQEPTYDRPGNQPEGEKQQPGTQQPDNQRSPWRPWQRNKQDQSSGPKDEASNLKDKEASGTQSLGKKDVDASNPEKSFYAPSSIAGATNPATRIMNRFFGTPKKKLIGLGGSTGIIIGLVFGFSMLQGPFMMTHFAQILKQLHLSHNESFSDARSMRNIVYTILNKKSQTRLGFVSNNFANKWESQLVKNSGLRPVYTSVGNRFAGFVVEDEKLASSQLADLEQDGIDTHGKPEFIVDKDGTKIDKVMRFVDLRDDKFRTRRSVIRTVGKGTDSYRVINYVGSRLLIKRGGIDFHPFKNIVRGKIDSSIYKNQIRKAQAEQARTGVIKNNKTISPDDSRDSDGNPVATQDDIDAANTANQATKDALAADAEGVDGGSTLRKIVKSTLKPTAVIGALCSVKAFGDGIPNFQYNNINMVEMRIAGRINSSGAQIQSQQDLNLDEVGVATQDLTDPETGLTVFDAKSIQAGLGQNPTGPDIPASAKPGKTGTKPLFFDVIDNIPALGTTCGVISATSNLPIIRNVTAWVSNAGITLINEGISVSGSHYTVEALLEDAYKLAAGRGANVYAVGPELGNLANYGEKLFANDQIIMMGGRALSDSEVLVLNQQQAQDEKIAYSHQSFTQKFLDPYNANTPVARLIDRTPSSISQITSSFVDIPSKFSSLTNGLVSLFTPKAHAAQVYDYGFPDYGFSADEQADPRFDDPISNASIVEPRLDELNTKFNDCFRTKVMADPASDGILLDAGVTADYSVINSNSNCTKFNNVKTSACTGECEDWLRYRFYIADSVTALSLACWEGDEGSCAQVGFGQTTGQESLVGSSPITTSPGANIEGDIGLNSESIACAQGTNDLGVVISNYTGAFKKEAGPLKIRLCQVSSIAGEGNNTGGVEISGGATVNSRASGAWQALGQAAKADGIKLSAFSSFRLAHSCNGTGDGGSCATPGNSAHQMGVAIDFAETHVEGDSLTSCSLRAEDPGNPAWEWLLKNAERFGFEQYTKESWHWDPLPTTNRCSSSERAG